MLVELSWTLRRQNDQLYNPRRYLQLLVRRNKIVKLEWYPWLILLTTEFFKEIGITALLLGLNTT